MKPALETMLIIFHSLLAAVAGIMVAMKFGIDLASILAASLGIVVLIGGLAILHCWRGTEDDGAECVSTRVNSGGIS